MQGPAMPAPPHRYRSSLFSGFTRHREAFSWKERFGVGQADCTVASIPKHPNHTVMPQTPPTSLLYVSHGMLINPPSCASRMKQISSIVTDDGALNFLEASWAQVLTRACQRITLPDVSRADVRPRPYRFKIRTQSNTGCLDVVDAEAKRWQDLAFLALQLPGAQGNTLQWFTTVGWAW